MWALTNRVLSDYSQAKGTAVVSTRVFLLRFFFQLEQLNRLPIQAKVSAVSQLGNILSLQIPSISPGLPSQAKGTAVASTSNLFRDFFYS